MKPDPSIVDKIRKRILVELFVTPYALFPFIGGCSLLMLAWATKAYGVFAFGGFISCVLGVGIALTNFLLNIDKFSEKALEQIKADVERKRNDRLNALAEKLKITREVKNWELKKDDDYLIDLRILYEGFLSDLEKQTVDTTSEMIVQVDQIFEECIKALEHSFDLYQTAGTMAPAQRKVVLDKRAGVLKEVDESVTLLSELMVKVRTMDTRDKNISLSKLRSELRTQLSAAEATKERLFEIEHGEDQNFDEYLKD